MRLRASSALVAIGLLPTAPIHPGLRRVSASARVQHVGRDGVKARVRSWASSSQQVGELGTLASRVSPASVNHARSRSRIWPTVPQASLKGTTSSWLIIGASVAPGHPHLPPAQAAAGGTVIGSERSVQVVVFLLKPETVGRGEQGEQVSG